MSFDEYKNSIYHRYPVTFGLPDKVEKGSDIVFHLPVLEYYASLCDHITEFGTREGHSTVAFLSGCKGKVISYDIEQPSCLGTLINLDLPCKSWECIQADTGSSNLNIDETDFLFFDTLHTYEHLSKELNFHARKSKLYLGFHDTETCGIIDKSGKGQEGISRAIQEFCCKFPEEYSIVYSTKANNGLLILKRNYL